MKSNIRTDNVQTRWCEAVGNSMIATASHQKMFRKKVLQVSLQNLHDQDAVLGKVGVKPYVLYTGFVVIAQLVKPQTIGGRLYQCGQLCLEHSILRGIQKALKYGILYPLAMVYAGFGNLAQTLAAGSGFGVDIIGY